MTEYSFADVLRLTRATRSQLIWWTNKRIIVPGVEDTRGPGHHRRFSFRNLFEIAIATELVDWKIPNERIGRIVEQVSLNTLGDADTKRLKLKGHNAADLVLYIEHDGVMLTIDGTVSNVRKMLGRSRRRAGVLIQVGALLKELERETGDSL